VHYGRWVGLPSYRSDGAIACCSIHAGHFLCVVFSERDDHFGDLQPIAEGQAAYHTVVDEPEPAVGQDQHVARMRVGVVAPVEE